MIPALTHFLLFQASTGLKNVPRGGDDPFAVLDPQEWANPANMTWADWQAAPGTNWSDPSTTGLTRNFNIALIAVDYTDRPFEITLPAQSTIYGNPQPVAGISNITRDAVPDFYRDFLNKPGTLHKGHTLHEYWMEDLDGRFGVDLTVYGAYEMPLKSYQYGIDDDMNTGGCPSSDTCNIDIRTDALGTWRAAVGNATADSYELVFILSAGQDESSTWQEFGEMKFQTREDVPDSFGPPDNGTNYAKTRYVDWTSWAAASNIWPNAGGGSSTQAESSGMATYAHEFSHLLNIGDNYNNPIFQWSRGPSYALADPASARRVLDTTASYVTMGDYRQLLDALFHVGTRSGSQYEYEYMDAANGLHFYIIGVERGSAGVLSYTTAVRSSNSSTDTSTLAVALSDGKIITDGGNVPTGKGVTCSFGLKNTGERRIGVFG
ncbi:putative secreted metallopeptidase [Lachnellula willkommii]|uniref:Putative secreted metallopeptidase n=1 Tax=Lachnellula willkommii TaxID=215461 RepID=A0A559M1Q7_9HELO|nr:putative secreted metallopeptidase [Lachnellula willkommii]